MNMIRVRSGHRHNPMGTRRPSPPSGVRHRVVVSIAALLTVALVATGHQGVGAQPRVEGDQVPVAEPVSTGFVDVPAGAFFAGSVSWLVDEQITEGVGTNPPRFGPQRPVTRAQMALFLWRLEGRPDGPNTCDFRDVPPDAGFAQAACWLQATGISEGVGGNRAVFAPADGVTRAQMAAFLWRYAGEPTVSQGALDILPAPCGFRDVPRSSFFTPAACWLKIKGVTTGVNNNPATYGPTGPVTRAQMAAFLDRLASSPETYRRLAPDAARFDCEVLDTRACLLPFPSNHFTRTDANTDTGLRVDYPRASMPSNRQGNRLDPTEVNRNDGFSPGSAMMVHLPGVDLEASGAAPITDKGSSLAADSPVVVINVDTGERHPHWVELDAQAADPNDKVTFVRPAVNFDEGARYAVVLRNLVDTDNNLLEPSEAFAALRDNTPSVPAVEQRRAAMETLFGELTELGFVREDMQLAWEFTVASERNLSERLLHIRDDAFGILGDNAPAFAINTGPSEPAGVQVLNNIRRVRGTISVPNYLTGTGGFLTTFNFGANDLPTRNTTFPNIQVPFWCALPDDADGDNQASMALSGHGLLQTSADLFDRTSLDWAVTEGNLALCAVDLWGLSASDLASVGLILQDLGRFSSLPDRGQQALLNMLVLGRAMKHPDGFSNHPAFQDSQGRSMIDTTDLYYNGNSQGGIMGGALMAVAQDFTRGLLGVPGMNYSTLLERSALAGIVATFVNSSYPDPIDVPVAMNVVQKLWDRSEANGYAHHVTTDPYRETPEKEIVIFMAFADEAVANVTTEVMARTMGIPVAQPALRPGRSPDVEPFWNLGTVDTFPHQGSVMLVWDFDGPPPPLTNTFPDPDIGPAPHTSGARLSALRNLVYDYLSGDGVVNKLCADPPCFGPPDV